MIISNHRLPCSLRRHSAATQPRRDDFKAKSFSDSVTQCSTWNGSATDAQCTIQTISYAATSSPTEGWHCFPFKETSKNSLHPQRVTVPGDSIFFDRDSGLEQNATSTWDENENRTAKDPPFSDCNVTSSHCNFVQKISISMAQHLCLGTCESSSV